MGSQSIENRAHKAPDSFLDDHLADFAPESPFDHAVILESRDFAGRAQMDTWAAVEAIPAVGADSVLHFRKPHTKSA